MKLIKGISVCIFWLAVWHIASIAVNLEIILPSPIVTFKALIALSCTPQFWITCGISLLRILFGLICGTAAALILAGITTASRLAYTLFSPILTIAKATPIASFIILALVWIGRGLVPSFISFLMVLPVIWSAVYQSISSVDKKLLEVGAVFNFTAKEKLSHIYMPSVLPVFKSAFITSIGLAWKSGVAAEVLCTPKISIGTSLFEAKKYLETADLFAWTVAVIILSLILENIFKYLLTKMDERKGK